MKRYSDKDLSSLSTRHVRRLLARAVDEASTINSAHSCNNGSNMTLLSDSNNSHVSGNAPDSADSVTSSSRATLTLNEPAAVLIYSSQNGNNAEAVAKSCSTDGPHSLLYEQLTETIQHFHNGNDSVNAATVSHADCQYNAGRPVSTSTPVLSLTESGSDGSHSNETPVENISLDESCRNAAHYLTNGEAVDDPSEADCSYHVACLVSDECYRCSLCHCFLACGACVHHPLPAQCVHCSPCNQKCDEVLFDKSDTDDEETIGLIMTDNKENDSSLQDNLAAWAVSKRITHDALSQLLKILKEHNSDDLSNLPKDPRTILCTLRQIEVRTVSPGLYWHNGIKKHLLSLFADKEEQEILLTFNVDGLPISASSSSALWPILCSVRNSKNVFVVGIYHGHGKPDSESEFLQDMVAEMTALSQEGLDIGAKHFSVSADCFVCDAPAKSFILNIKGHNGYFGCTKCNQKGQMLGRRMSFPETEFTERSDEGFLSQEQPEHHLGSASILSIPNVRPVSSFVLDPLHLLYLGVMKKLLTFWLFGSRAVKMGAENCRVISEMLHKMQTFIPGEFVRKPRKLDYVLRFKATEFRQILLYTGPVVFKPLKEEIYNHFIVLHVAVRLLSSPDFCFEFNDYAGALMKNFVENFKVLYGEEFVSHNIHGCLHINKDVLNYGPLEAFSAFKFENYMQVLKSFVRKGEKPLQQVAKRYSEVESVMEKKGKNDQSVTQQKFLHKHSEGPLTPGCGFPQYKVCKLSNATINVDHEADCCVSLTDGSIVIVKNFAHHGAKNSMMIVGMKFKYKEDLYESPISSSSLGIFKVHGFSSLMAWPVEKILQKLVRIPCKNKFAVFPLLHQEQKC